MAKRLSGWKLFGISSAIASFILLSILYASNRGNRVSFRSSQNIYKTQPLVMKDGDPYIRALMRTITASEANVSQPYNVLYGGELVSDLSDHPNRCIEIVTGPNVGNCTTAAGRYQFINTTWYEKARQYHPNPSHILWLQSYSFEPEYQDAVVYAWLSDPDAWGTDITQRLREGKVDDVLRLLSKTWTSLGYGIETNSMSSHLPQIYRKVLREELKRSQIETHT